MIWSPLMSPHAVFSPYLFTTDIHSEKKKKHTLILHVKDCVHFIWWLSVDLMNIWPLWWIYGKNNSHQMSRQWELHSCTEYIYAVVLTIIILCWNIVKPGQLYVCTIYHVTVWPYNITEFFFSSFLNKLIRCYLVQGLL